jgi:hypothetical protein
MVLVAEVRSSASAIPSKTQPSCFSVEATHPSNSILEAKNPPPTQDAHCWRRASGADPDVADFALAKSLTTWHNFLRKEALHIARCISNLMPDERPGPVSAKDAQRFDSDVKKLLAAVDIGLDSSLTLNAVGPKQAS